MKTGILSMQRIANYGSFLQAYALRKLLEEQGCEVEFVDYHPGKTLIPPDGKRGLSRKIKKATEAFSYGAPFSETVKFVNYKKNFGKRFFPLLGLSSKPNYSPELDVLVIGSDEVFNCVQNNVNVGYSPELFGAGNNVKKVISYAASFGNTTLEKLKEHGVYDEVRKNLSKLDALSLRDANSLKIIEEMGLKGVNHLDPVLTYDFKVEKKSPFERPAYKYMIVYGYSGRFSDSECREIRNYAQRKGLKIINIGGIQKCCDHFVDCTPEEVIHYFQNAECVVTDTFHGSILSIITERPFSVYVRNQGYGNSEKLVDLLERLELKDRIIKGSFMENIDLPIDWIRVEKIIENYRKSAKQYLLENLHD